MAKKIKSVIMSPLSSDYDEHGLKYDAKLAAKEAKPAKKKAPKKKASKKKTSKKGK
jgi:hypothetical protein